MEVGNFIGHDLHRFVSDGSQSERLYGVDVTSHSGVRYDSFGDYERPRCRTTETHFLSKHNIEFNGLKGKIDIAINLQVLQQFAWNDQTEAAKTLSTLTGPENGLTGNQAKKLRARNFH